MFKCSMFKYIVYIVHKVYIVYGLYSLYSLYRLRNVTAYICVHIFKCDRNVNMWTCEHVNICEHVQNVNAYIIYQHSAWIVPFNTGHSQLHLILGKPKPFQNRPKRKSPQQCPNFKSNLFLRNLPSKRWIVRVPGVNPDKVFKAFTASGFQLLPRAFPRPR